jgi:MoxR-like ATPase
MQEGLVTAAGTTYELPQPFLVLATQNPIEQEGTYPLPEAQLDRFMFNILIDYPGEDEEVEVIARTTTTAESQVEAVVNGAEIAAMARVVRAVPAAEPLVRYAVRLARASRPASQDAPEFHPRMGQMGCRSTRWSVPNLGG